MQVFILLKINSNPNVHLFYDHVHNVFQDVIRSDSAGYVLGLVPKAKQINIYT